MENCKEKIDFNKELTKFQVCCPVHKVNLIIEHPWAIAGMYMMSMNAKDLLDGMPDKTDLNDGTRLFFEPKHVAEIAQLFNGICKLFIANSLITEDLAEAIITDIIRIPLRSQGETYKSFKSLIESNLTYGFGKALSNNKKLYDNFLYILNNIWFIPYNKIDEIAQFAINEYSKYGNKDGDKNE